MVSLVAELRALLRYLALERPVVPVVYQGWQLAPVSGGANNLLYRATGPGGDLAIKWTIRDQRRRAEREYAALRALWLHGPAIAPQPLVLDQDSYAQPVVVQSWLPGEQLRAPPHTDDDWSRLLEHLAAVHSLTPADTDVQLSSAVLNADSAAGCSTIIRAQLALLPRHAQPPELQALLRRWERATHDSWPPPRVVLCRCDPNILNMLRRAGPWASVDWEYSGWGDGAFDLADLITHPAYADVQPPRWDWVVERYCRLTGDTSAALRIGVYRTAMLVWWVARLARVLFDVPRGGDRRLVERPAEWEATTRRKYHYYVELARTAVESHR